MKKRSELRSNIMTILYQIDIYKEQHIEYNIDDVIKDNDCSNEKFVNEVVNGVMDNIDDIDNTLNSLLEEWAVDRIEKTGAAILRMGLYELIFTDTPKAVVIDEAVELAKTYCSDELKGIVNAVLDKYSR